MITITLSKESTEGNITSEQLVSDFYGRMGNEFEAGEYTAFEEALNHLENIAEANGLYMRLVVS